MDAFVGFVNVVVKIGGLEIRFVSAGSVSILIFNTGDGSGLTQCS
jgi:hypothetical protein